MDATEIGSNSQNVHLRHCHLLVGIVLFELIQTSVKTLFSMVSS